MALNPIFKFFCEKNFKKRAGFEVCGDGGTDALTANQIERGTADFRNHTAVKLSRVLIGYNRLTGCD